MQQRVEHALDGRRQPAQPFFEDGRLEVQHRGDRRPLVGFGGQPVGLRILLVLQRVLGPPQQRVRFAERRDLVVGQQVALAQRLQRRQRALVAQRVVAAAAHDLEQLGRELDLADAAAPQLDVVAAFVARVALVHLRGDHVVQLAQRGEGLEIQVAPEHERRDDRFQVRLVSLRRVAQARVGDDPALEPGQSLPFAALRIEVVLEHRQRDHQRTGIAVRPQPRVDAEHEAVLGVLGQQVDGAPRQLVHELAGGDPAAGERPALVVQPSARLALFAEHEHQIQVGRDVQLEAAGLAHADRQQILGLSVSVLRHAVPLRQLVAGAAQRVAGRALRKDRHRRADLIERSPSADVALDQRHQHQQPRAPQAAHDGARIADRARPGTGLAGAGQLDQPAFDRRGVQRPAHAVAHASGQVEARRLAALPGLEGPLEKRRMPFSQKAHERVPKDLC
ncbi:MAG: hypothetical protein QM674_09770 [Burkholderiaceae bacterium]